MSACLFIRNDDVWTLDKHFQFFFNAAMKQRLPIIHAVIPGKMDKGLIRFLRRAKERNPELLDIVQHGWMHTNHSEIIGKKYEFGVSRSLKNQREDIHRGQERMRLAFGNHFTPAFVPPYHGYDERTMRILNEENFQIFSAGISRSKTKKRFLDIPAQISFSRYNQGRASVHSAQDMLGNLVRGIGRRPILGVVTHHTDFNTVESRRELTRFFDCVEALRNKKDWRILLFSDLWRK